MTRVARKVNLNEAVDNSQQLHTRDARAGRRPRRVILRNIFRGDQKVLTYPLEWWWPMRTLIFNHE